MCIRDSAQKKKNEAATDVSLTFKHALTQVNIEVTKEAGYTYTTVSYTHLYEYYLW